MRVVARSAGSNVGPIGATDLLVELIFLVIFAGWKGIRTYDIMTPFNNEVDGNDLRHYLLDC